MSANENALGGGIYVNNSSCIIVGNHIHNNEAKSFDSGWDYALGGGIYASESQITVANNLVEQNWIWLGATSSGKGAGIYAMYNCSGTFSNNVIASNYQQGYPSDSYGIGAAGCTLINNTIVNNANQGIRDAGEIRNCIVWGNYSGGSQIKPGCLVTYSDVQNGYSGEGNVSVYPEFTSGVLSDFQLDSSASPCIDAGDPAALYYDPEDEPGVAHWPAYGTVHNDMGAYGGPGTSFWFDGYTAVEKTAAGVEDGVSLIAGVSVNPVFGIPEIIIFVDNSVSLEIAIFDLCGRTAFSYSDTFSAGSHLLRTEELPPGVYLCRIRSAIESDTVRFTVVR